MERMYLRQRCDRVPLLSRRSRQRERLSASVLSICLFVCLSPKYKNAIFSKTKQFRAMVSIDDLYNVIFFIWGWSDLVQNHNDMSTAVIWSKSKLDVEFQYGGRLGELHGCHPRATRHVAGCCHLVNSLSWFQPHATLQGAVTWRNQCHDRATLQGVIIPSAILKIVIRQCFCFF